MELSKHTLNLRKGDMETLRQYFPKTGGSVVIRELVASFVDRKLKTELTGEEITELLTEE